MQDGAQWQGCNSAVTGETTGAASAGARSEVRSARPTGWPGQPQAGSGQSGAGGGRRREVEEGCDLAEEEGRGRGDVSAERSCGVSVHREQREARDVDG